MFLEIPGLPFKRVRFRKHGYFDGPVISEATELQKPKHLVSLGKSMWPKEVIDKISQMFKTIDLQDPERQKLVEPYAVAFGGMNVEGRQDLSNVNWEMVIDYFEWEVACHDENWDLSKKLQKKADKKYDGIFSHYVVYEE